jgi:glutathione synthase/RimK-type ligase-like ATP-grasp enzyme
VREFMARHGRAVYKSVSGVRSIVEEVGAEALARLDDIRWCPVQFQAYVEGVDVRVHVVGERVFATRVASDAADYRYAGVRDGVPARLEATRLSEAVEARCVDLTARLGLRFGGIDLRITPDDRVVCFEVNPCPAYTYYEGNTGQPIARAVAHHLAGMAA